MKKRVDYKNFHLYNKFCTKQQKMYSGAIITGLFPIKQTKKFHIGLESWAYNCSSFKQSLTKPLECNIPQINEESSLFLIEKMRISNEITIDSKGDEKDAFEILKRLFPNKRFFIKHGLNELISKYCRKNDFNIEDLEYLKLMFKTEDKNILFDVCKNSVVLPTAFKDRTAQWSKEKYGNYMGFSQAGDILFVTNNDYVFLNINRYY